MTRYVASVRWFPDEVQRAKRAVANPAGLVAVDATEEELDAFLAAITSNENQDMKTGLRNAPPEQDESGSTLA